MSLHRYGSEPLNNTASPTVYLNGNSTNGNVNVPGSFTVEFILLLIQKSICIISILSLIVLMVVYLRSPSLRKRLATQLTIGLAFHNAVLLLIYLSKPIQQFIDPPSERTFCLVQHCAFYYFFLGTFSWMAVFGVNVLYHFGIHQCIIFICGAIRSGQGSKSSKIISTNAMRSMVISSAKRAQSNKKKHFMFSFIIATLIPVSFLIPAMVINEKVYPNKCFHINQGSDDMDSVNQTTYSNCTGAEIYWAQLTPGFCPPGNLKDLWFTSKSGIFIWAFLPITFMLCFNYVTLIAVGIYIWYMKREKHVEERESSGNSNISRISPSRRQTQLIRAALQLSTTLGILWVLQLCVYKIKILLLITSFASSSQGFLIAVLSLYNTRSSSLSSRTR